MKLSLHQYTSAFGWDREPDPGLDSPETLLLFLRHLQGNGSTILAVNEEDQSITFAGDIPTGGFVRLMRANFDRVIEGASDPAADVDTQNYASGPLLNAAISCVGRRLVLGPRTEKEIEATLEGLPGGASQIGCYSYGEISPLASGKCDLHNQSMTLTTLWEQ